MGRRRGGQWQFGRTGLWVTTLIVTTAIVNGFLSFFPFRLVSYPITLNNSTLNAVLISVLAIGTLGIATSESSLPRFFSVVQDLWLLLELEKLEQSLLLKNIQLCTRRHQSLWSTPHIILFVSINNLERKLFLLWKLHNSLSEIFLLRKGLLVGIHSNFPAALKGLSLPSDVLL